MLPWLLLTATCSLWLAVMYVSARWKPDLRVSRLAKRLTQCEADVLDCMSAQSRLLELTKKVSSRQAVADFRATATTGASRMAVTSAEDIPFGDKAALRAKFLPKGAVLAPTRE